jgi:arabinose-5-phosphate isomerase
LIKKETILASAKKTILSESESIAKLTQFLDDNFVNAVEIIYKSKGRLVVTGIGKSAIIAQKIVATLNSTGTPSLFLHASEAIHGDLGMLQPSDVVICISKSGNSPEIKVLAINRTECSRLQLRTELRLLTASLGMAQILQQCFCVHISVHI